MSNFNSTSLTVARLREVLHYDPDTGAFTWKLKTALGIQVGSEAGTLNNRGYRIVRLNGKGYSAHRLAWLYVNGVWPENQIDHINRTRNDNRIANLREASCAENLQNTVARSTNTSGHKGIHWLKQRQRWVAHITHQYSQIYLGLFADINDAVAARKKAEEQLHPFAAK